MICVSAIGRYIPEARHDNRALMDKFSISDDFLSEKIGVTAGARRAGGEDTSDMCRAAFADLSARCGVAAGDLDALAVVTQNPDGRGLPHTAAAVHDKIGASQQCAVFDISQGCAGFVYGLAAVQGFMQACGLRRAVLFTCDPYSKILDPEDRNTVLLFGDAATATLIEAGENASGWRARHFRFLTLSAERGALENRDGKLFMNGRGIFNFAAVHVPREIRTVMTEAGLVDDDIDVFALHQGSKYIVDQIAARLRAAPEKVPFEIDRCGNTVSSSVPLLLYDRLGDDRFRRILVCGFGVGLSVGTCVLERN